MSQISINSLTFCYEGSYDNVFEDVSFQLDTDWKCGLVGRTGRGKTTLLKLLAGELPTRAISKSVICDYFPWAVDGTDFVSDLADEIPQWELVRELSRLELSEEVLWRPFGSLSPGEQTKVQLALLFLRGERFLLIDEPTNHLDERGRLLVGEYLKSKKGFLLVSHDRRFLDQCVDHIVALNRNSIEVQRGSFSSWYKDRETRNRAELSKNEKLKREIERLSRATRQTSGWSEKLEKTKKGERTAGLRPDRGAIGHKAAKMMKRAKVTEARRDHALAEKKTLLKDVERADPLKLIPLVHHADCLISAQDLTLAYEENSVCGPLTFELRRGDRIVLQGQNGCGKSSLIKLILNLVNSQRDSANVPCHRPDVHSMQLLGRNGVQMAEPGENSDSALLSHTGRLFLASGLIISYVPQDASHLSGSLSDYIAACEVDETRFKTILRKMDFARIQFEKDLRELSGGQKKKILIARSLCQQAHLYIWDEPLNFIDIFSRIQIEELICSNEPTMLFVEHDRAFCEKIATGSIEFKKNRHTVYRASSV